MKEFEFLVAEENKIELEWNQFEKHFFEFSEIQDSDAGNTTRQVSQRKLFFN